MGRGGIVSCALYFTRNSQSGPVQNNYYILKCPMRKILRLRLLQILSLGESSLEDVLLLTVNGGHANSIIRSLRVCVWEGKDAKGTFARKLNILIKVRGSS